MSSRLFILLKSFFLSGKERDTKNRPWASGPILLLAGLPSFLSILLIMRRRGSMYLDSCFSLSRYCCSSAWLEPAGLMTELGFTIGDRVGKMDGYKLWGRCHKRSEGSTEPFTQSEPLGGERGFRHLVKLSTQPRPNLPGVFKGPGEGTLKFCGVRAVTGL